MQQIMVRFEPKRTFGHRRVATVHANSESQRSPDI